MLLQLMLSETTILATLILISLLPLEVSTWNHYNIRNTRELLEPPIGHEVFEEPACVDRPCRQHEDCCENAVCVTHMPSKTGICSRYFDRPEGKLCQVNEDCAPGLECIHIHERFKTVALCTHQKALNIKKQYFDICSTSYECATQKGLCCREQPRDGSGVTRKICSYFEDPLEDCIF